MIMQAGKCIDMRFPGSLCSKGGLRSPAVAAALLKMSVRSDEAVCRNPYYVPNTLVYYRLCRENGLRISKMGVWLKVMTNRRVFSLAQKGRPCKYERWEILERKYQDIGRGSLPQRVPLYLPCT